MFSVTLASFGFQPFDFKVQFHPAVELLFLRRLGAQDSQVALEPGVGLQAVVQCCRAVGGIRRGEHAGNLGGLQRGHAVKPALIEREQVAGG